MNELLVDLGYHTDIFLEDMNSFYNVTVHTITVIRSHQDISKSLILSAGEYDIWFNGTWAYRRKR